MAKSTLGPLWLCIPDNGGYNVQPVPTPFSIILANKNKIKLGGNNQKLILFNLGNAMSGPPTNNGNKKLPNPPINAGITMKKIIVCFVIALSLTASGSAFAQQNQNGGQMQQMMRQYLKDSLKLSDALTDSVVAIRMEYQPKIREMFRDQSLGCSSRSASRRWQAKA